MSKLALNLNDLKVSSFSTQPSTAQAAQSEIIYTVYYYYETEQITCGTASCGGSCDPGGCWV
jgi:hypothetical protein